MERCASQLTVPVGDFCTMTVQIPVQIHRCREVALVGRLKSDRGRPVQICSRLHTHMGWCQALTACVLTDGCPVQALGSTLSQVRNRPVDVVLFLSRLDEFRVDASDRQASSHLTNLLGG